MKASENNFFFTVNASGKKVRFAPGNLYWDGKEFRFEKHQYDYPTERKPDHIGHFFRSKYAAKAIAPRYNDGKAQCNDKFFAANGGAIKGYTVLSEKEWDYLIDNAIAKKAAIINGKKCVILKPDGFVGTVKDSYSAEEWTNAESEDGLVALPFVGFLYGSSFLCVGSYGFYWSSTPDGSSSAWRTYFSSGGAGTNNLSRYYGYSVRLVSVQNSL